MITLLAGAEGLIRQWLARCVPEGEILPILFTSRTVRQLRGTVLPLNASDCVEAMGVRMGWLPALWTEKEAGRILVIAQALRNGQSLTSVEMTADIGEKTALIKALPLWVPANPTEHAEILAVARRTARDAVGPEFRALALDNPYPGEQFPPQAMEALVERALAMDLPMERMSRMSDRPHADILSRLRELIYQHRSSEEHP